MTDGGVARRLALVARPLLPLEPVCVHDVEAHGATIPSAPVAEAATASRALPRCRRERTVGQLVAESIRFYGEPLLARAPARHPVRRRRRARASATDVNVQTVDPLGAARRSSALAIVRACLDRRRRAGPTLARRSSPAVVIFLPFPVLVRLYILPGVAWFGALRPRACRPRVVERLGVRAGASSAAAQLAPRRPRPRARRLATLALVFGVSRCVLLVLLHTQGNQTQTVALVLADLVLSPLLFVGAALLYVDQAARVK